MALPEEVLKWNQSDEEENARVLEMHSVMSQYRKSQGLEKVKYPKTSAQRDAEARKKKWRRAKSRFCEKAVDRMHEAMLKSKEIFATKRSVINYADVPIQIDYFPKDFLKALDATMENFVFCGFDTEGAGPDVLQLRKLTGRCFARFSN